MWVTTPAGVKKRKYVYGPTREAVHVKWLELHQAAARGAVETKSKTVERYLHAWLEEVIRPNREPKTYDGYERFIRLHIVPWLGKKMLDRLSARDIQQWANKLATVCQCCEQGVDELRTPHKCCAKGKCCRKVLSARSISDARTVLRSALSQAVTDELVSVDRAMQIRLPSGRKRRKKSWSTDEARRFLEHVRADPHYAAYLLVLAMALRKGEVLGLTWDSLDLDEGILEPQWQLQRVMGELIHKKKAKTEESENALPMPDLCIKALRDAGSDNCGTRRRPTSGTTRIWSSPPGTGRRSSRATFTGTSSTISRRRSSPGSRCMTPGEPVARCWWISMSTLG
jgi:integrase